MPVKGGTSYHVAVEASLGEASVVVNDGTNLYHRQVQPGIVLSASPKKWDGDKASKVKVKVTDAATAIAGAKVAGGGEKCTTKSNGTCVLKFPAHKPGKIKLKATKSGYSPCDLQRSRSRPDAHDRLAERLAVGHVDERLTEAFEVVRRTDRWLDRRRPRSSARARATAAA